MRAGTRAKLDNYSYLNKVLTELQEKFLLKGGKALSESELQEAIGDGLPLHYYESADGKTLYGDKIITDVADDKRVEIVNEQANKFAENADTTVAIITDHPELYSAHDNVTVIDINAAQGGEWDYVILDADLSSHTNNNTLSLLKCIYTMSQRAVKGTVLLENPSGKTKWSSVIKVTNNDASDPTYNYERKPDATQLNEYKEWRLKALNEAGITNAKDLGDYVKSALNLSDTPAQPEPEASVSVPSNQGTVESPVIPPAPASEVTPNIGAAEGNVPISNEVPAAPINPNMESSSTMEPLPVGEGVVEVGAASYPPVVESTTNVPNMVPVAEGNVIGRYREFSN